MEVFLQRNFFLHRLWYPSFSHKSGPYIVPVKAHQVHAANGKVADTTYATDGKVADTVGDKAASKRPIV